MSSIKRPAENGLSRIYGDSLFHNVMPGLALYIIGYGFVFLQFSSMFKQVCLCLYLHAMPPCNLFFLIVHIVLIRVF